MTICNQQETDQKQKLIQWHGFINIFECLNIEIRVVYVCTDLSMPTYNVPMCSRNWQTYLVSQNSFQPAVKLQLLDLRGMFT